MGYGAFNNRNLNVFVLSSGSGYGMVTDKSGKETYMGMGSLGGGLGLGGKDLSVVFIFKTPEVMNKFIESGWQFGGEADATAKAGDKGRCGFEGSGCRHRRQSVRDLPNDGHGGGAPGDRRGHQVFKDKDLNK